MVSFRRLLIPVLLGSTVLSLPGGSTPVLAASGRIEFPQTQWGMGSLPSLTFTVGAGGSSEKMSAFLFFSDGPDAFRSSNLRPQFVGVLSAPSSVKVILDRPPERTGPINRGSHEGFVQGALFDLQSGLLLSVTNEIYLDIHYDAQPSEYRLDFETEDDFATPLSNGQDLTTPPEFGELVRVSARQPFTGPPNQGLAIFDSDLTGPNSGSSDRDLLVGLGNVVILQENAGQTQPGFFDLPDDSANGGSVVFDIVTAASIEGVEPRSIDLVDVDNGGVKVFLTDALGKSRVYSAPDGWTGDVQVQGPGYRTLDLSTLKPQLGFASTATTFSEAGFLADEVKRIEVVLLGSGAVDNLVFRRENGPAPLVTHGGSTPGGAGITRER